MLNIDNKIIQTLAASPTVTLEPLLIQMTFATHQTPIVTTTPHLPRHPDLGILVDTTVKFHDHIRSIVNKANGLASSLLKATLNRSRKFMVTVYKTHIRPLLEFSSCIFYNEYIGDLKLLESPQRRWTKNKSGL